TKGDYVLIGFDMKKDIRTLELAYNDPAGVTGEFNFNLLDRINRELGANFKRRTFIYRAHYNPGNCAIESWLISKIPHTVKITYLRKQFSFEKWEGLQTEFSFKYTKDEIHKLATAAGFSVEEWFFDPKKYFVDVLLKA